MPVNRRQLLTEAALTASASAFGLTVGGGGTSSGGGGAFTWWHTPLRIATTGIK